MSNFSLNSDANVEELMIFFANLKSSDVSSTLFRAEYERFHLGPTCIRSGNENPPACSLPATNSCK